MNDPGFFAHKGRKMGGSGSKRPPAKSQAAPVQRASPAVNKTVQTTQMMRNTVNRLEKRKNLLETKAMQAKKQAIQMKKAGNKRQAVAYLRRFKQYEKESLKMHNVIAQVETQQLALESSGVLGDAVGAMNAGLSQQQRLRGKLNPDNIADTLDEIHDIQEENEEIHDILGSNFADGLDDADLMAELDGELGLMEEYDGPSEIAAELPSLDLPSVASSNVHDLPPVRAETNYSKADEEALRQLEAELL